MEDLNNMTEVTQPAIDIKAMFQTLWERRKVFYWVIPITFVLSAALILCVPRYYTCEIVLAPETQNAGSSGSLQALASSFGVDMHSMTSSDAIYPTIYPDVVKSPDFLVTLFDIPVTTADNSFSGTFYDYLLKGQKSFFLKRWKRTIISWIPKPKETNPMLGHAEDGTNTVFYLNKQQWAIIKLLNENINCTVDRRTDVITFSVTAQDKLICATIGDSLCASMQTFITNYRTKKTRDDIAYYKEVMHSTFQEYQDASSKYIEYIDSHSNMRQEKYRIAAHNLETEMQIKQAAYISFQKQYLAAEARLQENTPVYTVIQSASIPPKPAGPRRMMFVLAMLFLTTCFTIVIICKDQLFAFLK